MSGAQKFSLSLLISVVVFSGFAVLAWSGLFDYIETTFYLDRVQSGVQTRVDRISDETAEFHRVTVNRFSLILTNDSVRRAFDVDQAGNDIDDRRANFQDLEVEFPSLDYVRIVDLGGTRLHFSTRPGDFTQTGTTRTYSPISTLDESENISIASLAYPALMDEDGEVVEASRDLLVGESIPDPVMYVDPVQNQLIYRLPVVDDLGVLQGAALFYVQAGGLNTWLVREGLVGAGDSVVLFQSESDEFQTVDEALETESTPRGWIVVNSAPGWSETLSLVLPASAEAFQSESRPVVLLGDGASFVLFAGAANGDVGSAYPVLYLFPRAQLEMTQVMRIVLLAAIFLTVFLLVFLLFNLRQDAVVVMSDRVKRFQISLLREYVENKQDLDFRRWRAELEDRRDEVAVRIRRGLGRVRPSQREEVDKLIDSSWDEILEVLGARAAQESERGVDLDRLEDIVERVIGNLQNAGPLVQAPPARRVGSAPGEPIEVEELTEEELEGEEVAELGEPVEVEELTEEELEEGEEVAELGEPIEVEDLTEEELEEGEEVAELGELIEVEELTEEELEKGEEVAELGEPTEVEELTEEELEEPAAGADELDEELELRWLAESEALDVSSVSLEHLDTEDAESIARLEGESISDDAHDDDVIELLEEIDHVNADSFVGMTLVNVESVDLASDEEPEIAEASVEAPAAAGDGIEELEEAAIDEAPDGELEWARSESTPFLGQTFSFTRGVADELPAVAGEDSEDEIEDLAELGPDGEEPELAGELEEVGELEDAEELEAAEELDGEEEGVPQRRAETAPLVLDSVIRFSDLSSYSTADYEIAAIGDILDRLHIDKRVIVDRDGLVEIDRKAYSGASAGSDEQTRDLIESVVGDGDEAPVSGVEELFGGGEEIDLFADLNPAAEAPVANEDPERSVFRFMDRGFDYDGFLRGFRATDGGIIKSIVTFTRHWQAGVGVLLSEGAGELVPEYGLGLEEACLNALRVTQSSGIYRNVLEKRLALFVNRPLRRVEYFHGLCSDDQMSYFQKALFLPVIFRGEEGYVLLGLSEDINSLDDAFRKFVPLLTSVAAV